MKKKHKNLKDAYQEEYLKNTDNPNAVDYNLFKGIVQLFFIFLLKKIFDGDEVTLPARMGTLFIRGTKEKPRLEGNEIKGLSINWGKTKALRNSCPEAMEKRTRVYNTNEHSSGIRYKFIWSKSRVLVQFKSVYSFRMIRSYKRELSRLIINEKKEYITI